MKTTSFIFAIAVMLGLSSSAFAMRSDVAVDSQGTSAKCGLQTVALDPNGPIVRCY